MPQQRFLLRVLVDSDVFWRFVVLLLLAALALFGLLAFAAFTSVDTMVVATAVLVLTGIKLFLSRRR